MTTYRTLESLEVAFDTVRTSTSNYNRSSNLPQFGQAIQSSDKKLIIAALRSILDIVIYEPDNIEVVYEIIDVGTLNKLIGSGNEGDIYVLSTAILHIVGVRCGVKDIILRFNAATEPVIQLIHSSNEKRSRSGSKTLCDLIEDNEGIRNSLINTGFIQIVLHSIAAETPIKQLQASEMYRESDFKEDRSISFPSYTSTQSYNSETDLFAANSIRDRCPLFVQIRLLKVVLRLAKLGYGLGKLGVLISGLERLKRHKDAQLRNVAENILQILYSQGIIQSPVSTITSKDVIVCELEEQIRRKIRRNWNKRTRKAKSCNRTVANERRKRES
ncbi:MAG: hypothetical protein EZS28_028548 [Streblomastix strix]|uniref:Uncharacterized protein n=1 Tax=Streblomastix strix TaxID=222440 RepID=A0A5J4V1H8_9EUKA|nr:MAG: hypothetical protein EZS28_028548 [Streblomastix strix]